MRRDEFEDLITIIALEASSIANEIHRAAFYFRHFRDHVLRNTYIMLSCA